MRVLLVEDHEVLAETVATGLRREGIAVDVAYDGRDALAHTAVTSRQGRGRSSGPHHGLGLQASAKPICPKH